ncbi:MAG: radical SAM protein [Fuerstiella sp.]
MSQIQENQIAIEVSKYHVTVLSNFARGYDKYSGEYCKDRIPESTFSDRFHLLDVDDLRIGIDRNRRLLEKLELPGNELIVVETRVSPMDLFVTEQTGLGHYVRKRRIRVHRLYLLGDEESLVPISSEELMARSLMLLRPGLACYADLEPRSISVLPISSGCQAECSFCFSAYSVSTDQATSLLSSERVESLFNLARRRGARRAVITGGGEPTLYPQARLTELIRLAAKYFPEKVVLITNGYAFSKLHEDARLQVQVRLQDAGLTTLVVSHHHWDRSTHQSIMKLDVDLPSIAETLQRHADRFPTLAMRLICVLQKDGVDICNSIERYIQWAAALNIKEVCFKELYVSTSVESVYHSKPANDWSRRHQNSIESPDGLSSQP